MKYIRFALLISSLILIIAGFSLDVKSIAITGSCMYLLYLLSGSIALVLISFNQKDNENLLTNDTLFSNISKGLEG